MLARRKPQKMGLRNEAREFPGHRTWVRGHCCAVTTTRRPTTSGRRPSTPSTALICTILRWSASAPRRTANAGRGNDVRLRVVVHRRPIAGDGVRIPRHVYRADPVYLVGGMTAFRAAFADFKLIRTRSTAQFVFEVPLEQADQALAILGGIPKPGAEQWVGVAPIRPDAPEPTAVEKERRPFRTLPRSQQAAMKCGEPEFQRWTASRGSFPATADGAAEYVRRACNVASRRDLDSNPEAGRLWDGLLTEFDYRDQLR